MTPKMRELMQLIENYSGLQGKYKKEEYKGIPESILNISFKELLEYRSSRLETKLTKRFGDRNLLELLKIQELIPFSEIKGIGRRSVWELNVYLTNILESQGISPDYTKEPAGYYKFFT